MIFDCLYEFQHLLCMIFGINLISFFDNSTGIIEQEAMSKTTHILFAIHGFFCPGLETVIIVKWEFGIGNEWEGKFIFILEFAMRLVRIMTYSDDLYFVVGEFII